MSRRSFKPAMTDQAWGILAVSVACTIWGLSPIFYKEVRHLPPLDVLAHRTLWSLVFFLIYLAMRRRLSEVPRAFTGGQAGLILLAATMVSANWFLFILSTQIDRVTEASLGYFIFPLVAVLIGRFWFAEPMTVLQWCATGLAALGVLVLTIGLGVAPWISLVLAITFGIYSAVKKSMHLGPVLSVACEVLVFLPFALIILSGVFSSHAITPSSRDLVFLVLSGPLTGGPLMLFAYAARRASLVAVGLLQFINPMLQFLCAVLIFAEPFTGWHGTSFVFIWLALGVYSVTLVRQAKASRNVATVSGTEPATLNRSHNEGSAKP